MLKLVTVLGTRPEIIRLSRIIPALDEHFDHTVIHTGQNFVEGLSDVFFREFGLRAPDYFIGASSTSLSDQLADIFRKSGEILGRLKPDGLLVLGDTNSSLVSLIAKRMGICVFHIEAGNRSFDANVPEEINRKVVDGLADVNMTYSRHARENLLKEGHLARNTFLVGSPMAEVLAHYSDQIRQSRILNHLKLEPGRFFLASAHRQENIDLPHRLRNLLDSLEALGEHYELPVVISTHPRLKSRLGGQRRPRKWLKLLDPLGYFDYCQLQTNALCVVSDSGSVSEESYLLNFPAVTIRDSFERPEALDAGRIFIAGVAPDSVLDSVRMRLALDMTGEIEDYEIGNTTERVLAIIQSVLPRWREWAGIRDIKSV